MPRDDRVVIAISVLVAPAIATLVFVLYLLVRGGFP